MWPESTSSGPILLDAWPKSTAFGLDKFWTNFDDRSWADSGQSCQTWADSGGKLDRRRPGLPDFDRIWANPGRRNDTCLGALVEQRRIHISGVEVRGRNRNLEVPAPGRLCRRSTGRPLVKGPKSGARGSHSEARSPKLAARLGVGRTSVTRAGLFVRKPDWGPQEPPQRGFPKKSRACNTNCRPSWDPPSWLPHERNAAMARPSPGLACSSEC